MKALKFSDTHKAFVLKQGVDGIPVIDTCRKAGISQVTCFDWKKRYDGLLSTEMRRLKLLKDAVANVLRFGSIIKLRKLAADLLLDRGICRMSSAEDCETYSQVQAGRWDACELESVDPARLPGARGRHVHLPLQVPSAQSGRARSQN